MSRVSRSSSEAEDIWETEDDMTKGDLGYGLGRKPGGIYEVPRSITSKKRSDGKNPSPPSLQRKGEERSETIFQCSRNKGVRDTCADGGRAANYRRLSSTDSNSELSDEQLRRRLHEALEEVEILKTELEASQRQLEGKEEALKILQSMVMLGKATSHTQAMLQKTIEQKKSLEKEINALQWEMEFDQDRFKNIEESWIQKYDRLNCDNAVLREDLKLRTEEIRMLKSENAVLNQRYLEALAMLDIRQQKMAQENMGQEESGFTEVSGLELAVLGACLCHGPGGSPCSCARMAASTRKLVLQLRHELETVHKSKEEAHMTADAFRIAFEQQLMRKNDQALRLARGDVCRRAATRMDRQRRAEDGYPAQRRKKTLGQRLLGILPSENSSKHVEDQDNPQEVLKMLIDLLNDKEEALAHQRKVSYMLARALEDKDTASKRNKEKIPVSQTFPFKTAWQDASELRGLHDPLHANHVSEPVGCNCSIQHPQKVSDCSRTLKRSRSLPSNL
ncbi:coiled-coil domain-containing protein 125 isoform X1 [Apodemus sylvaticus]|uniref:coiled-coil domain-containing protein 125 isoform X1 n=1 Tax=Apodemus sylvaticus TaxID=10129 RepID=UPI002243A6D8|nr:coiled-coil domain-containing protein 125 isoform X1 [Apodemus sylvaticus]XP_052015664.1 coiled-coil domain-containing protein 125 isoform X1 [Apodemus sylvaticus]